MGDESEMADGGGLFRCQSCGEETIEKPHLVESFGFRCQSCGCRTPQRWAGLEYGWVTP